MTLLIRKGHMCAGSKISVSSPYYHRYLLAKAGSLRKVVQLSIVDRESKIEGLTMSNEESTSKDHQDLKAQEKGCNVRGTEGKVLRHSTELLQIGTDSHPSSLLLQKKSSSKVRGSLETFRPQPSAVLSSVKRFLPQLSAANEQLQTVAPGQLDIQNVEDCEGPVIEMDLALIPTGEDSLSSSSESSSEEEEEEEEEEAGGLDGDNQSDNKNPGLMGEVTEQNLRLGKDSRARTRPKIEELGGDQPRR